MNNKIHEKADTIIQKESIKKIQKDRITQPKLIQKNKTKNCPEYVPHLNELRMLSSLVILVVIYSYRNQR